MASLLSRLFGSSQALQRLGQKRARIGLEVLEDRTVPAVSLSLSSLGQLTIQGTDAGDTVSVSMIHATFYNPAYVQVTANGVTTYIKYASAAGGSGHDGQLPETVRAITFYGRFGNDVFVNNTAIPCTAYGDGGIDYLYGGSAGDSLYGGSETDYLYGGEGTDCLYGNAGADYLYGQGGDDTLNGGDDGFADYLNGGAGRDKFQQEGYGQRGGLTAYSNRDEPADFNPIADSLYGSDDLVAGSRQTSGSSLLTDSALISESTAIAGLR